MIGHTRKFIIAILIVIGILTFVFLLIGKKGQKSIVEKPLSSLVTIDLSQNCKLYIVINPDSVWVEPFENVCSNAKSFSIEKSQYPNLFKQGVANESFISVEKSLDPTFSLIISNNQPDHGGFLPVYQLMVNPKTGDIKEYKTYVETFIPTTIPTKSVKGNCWVSSLASPLNDNAWRCMTGDSIFDPCFGTSSGKVICDSYPDDTKNAFVLDLDSALPARSTDSGGWRYYSKETPSNDDDFWILELENGYKCYAYTGTLPSINGQPYYYYCSGNGEDMYAGQVWSSTPVFTTTLVSQKYNFEDNVDPSKIQQVNIIKAWK